MKRVVLAAVLCICWPATAETLVFAPLPLEAPETVAAQWKPLLDPLGKALGVTVRIEYTASYDEILDKFKNGQIDLAYLGPLPYIALRAAFEPAVPLVLFNESDGRQHYTCALIAPAGAKLAPKDIKGKTVALTRPLSTCGYFFAETTLRQAGGTLEHNRYRYLGRHDEVALAVIRGEFDVGALKTAIARKYAGLGLALIAESAPLPGFALVANSATVSPARIAQIRKYLLEANDTTRSGWGVFRHGVSPAQDGDYAAVRRMRGAMKIPEKGNF